MIFLYDYAVCVSALINFGLLATQKKFDKIKFNKYIKIPTSFAQVGSLVGKTDESKHQ